MKGSQGSKEQMKKEALSSAHIQSEQFTQAFSEVSNKMFKQHMTPKEALNVNSNVLESVYAQAYRLYNTGKYIEAAHLFRILIMMNVTEPKYLLGLAACFHMLKEYQNAIQTYTMCSALGAQDPIPYYHSSDCFIQMKDYLSAMICLEMTIARAADKPEYAKMKERALMSLESLKKHVTSSPDEGLSEESS